MTYELPEPDLHDGVTMNKSGRYTALVKGYTADTLRAEVAKAEQRGRNDMQRECTALCMTRWLTDDERAYGQEVANVIRSLK